MSKDKPGVVRREAQRFRRVWDVALLVAVYVAILEVKGYIPFRDGLYINILVGGIIGLWLL